MNVVSQFLTEIGLWPKPHLSKERADRAVAMLGTARREADRLADELEIIADKADDPFADFAERARASRL